MNIEINNKKRKKRRTRKYFNEIRKRSQRYSSRLTKDHDYDDNDKVQTPKKNSNNVTNKRLTLSMFPKAVRSETITRPVLAEIKHKQNYNDIVKDKNAPTVLNTIMNDKFQTKNDEQQNASNKLLEAKEVVHDEKSTVENESPFGSFVLVSPIYRDKENDESNETEIKPFSPIPQVETSEFYKSFMEELPHLLRKSVPEKFFKYNIMKDLRAQLDEISTEILKSPTEPVTSIKRNKSTKINRVVENPLEYLRLAQTDKDGITVLHNSSSETSKSPSCMHSTLPLRSMSIIQDTPEYNYYPHKLH